MHLVVRRLAERTVADVYEAPALPDTVDEAADRLTYLLDAIGRRVEDVRARHVLAGELVDDPELHSFVTYASPVQSRLVGTAAAVLTRLDVDDPAHHAVSLLAIMDGLLFHRLSGAGVEQARRADARAVLHAYLSGLPRTTTA